MLGLLPEGLIHLCANYINNVAQPQESSHPNKIHRKFPLKLYRQTVFAKPDLIACTMGTKTVDPSL
jgi:hypothetical protein